MELMNNKPQKIDYIVRGHKYAKTLNITNIKKNWIDLFNMD